MFARGRSGVFGHLFGYPPAAQLTPIPRRLLTAFGIWFGIADQIFVHGQIAPDAVGG